MVQAGRPRGFDRSDAIAAAMLLFWRQGYEAASLLQLREAMGGLSSASFYAAFGSKEGLFREVVARYRDEHGEAAAALRDPVLAPRQAVATALMTVARTQADENRPAGDLLAVAALVGAEESQSIRDLLAAERQRLRAGFLGCVARAIAADSLPPETSAAGLAGLCETVMFGLSVQARDGVASAVREASVAQLMAMWDQLATGRA